MTASQSLKIYEVLQKHFRNDEDAKKDILLTKDDKIDLIDRINKAKIETIIWIVGIGVLQFVLSYLLKT